MVVSKKLDTGVPESRNNSGELRACETNVQCRLLSASSAAMLRIFVLFPAEKLDSFNSSSMYFL